MNRTFFSSIAAAVLYSLLGVPLSALGTTGLATEHIDPVWAQSMSMAYEAYLRHDAPETSKQASLLPADQVLRPWANAWAALADPSADPSDLFARALSFPHSLMRWRLLEESAVRHAKAGALDKAKASLALLPEGQLGPQGRCAAALVDPRKSVGKGVDLLSQGSGSTLCSRAALADPAMKADGFGAAFLRIGAAKAVPIGSSEPLSSNPLVQAGLAAQAALSSSPHWDPSFPLSSREALSRQVATGLGSGHCSESILHPPAHLTDRGMANAARCSLWMGSPAKAATYWDALHEAKPTEPRWALLSALARGRPAPSGFPATSYFQLASVAIWGAQAPQAQPGPMQGAHAPAATCSDAGVDLALSLWTHGVHKEADAAWRDALDRSDPATRSCLGARADALGAHPLRIAAYAGNSYDARAYKAGYAELISAAARRQGVDPDLLASVARQESRFDERAVSRSGALGLFQIMPATSRDIATQAHIQPPSPAVLLDAKSSAEMAAYHLSKLLTQFKGDIPWSLCAYNAGAGRCKGWKTSLSALPTALRIEAMPYDETRIYVERILAGWSLSSTPDPSRGAFLGTGMARMPGK